MVKPKKLLAKILSGSKNIRFDEFVALLEAFGFVLTRISGSHRIYTHSDVPRSFPVQPTDNGQAKPYQVRQFLKLIEQYELRLLDSDGENGQ
ncbi:MAG TPA: type II toxin-antitoxin system HicA family toxin [Phototrophicaceae bacterium]|jgi:predicted RNA binding protein YcfA (HicA-like mRNA interferase family)|nr:type II toxin-antitoxin system HicA family toxin [Phototrophicaceae bacterium]